MKKLRIVFIALLVFGILAVYFRPRPLRDILKVAEINPDGTAYCTLFDLTQGRTRNWSDSAAVFFDSSDELFWPFMNEVTVAGPVFYTWLTFTLHCHSMMGRIVKQPLSLF